ncbi:MAG: hypothetical protein PSU94_06405 [Lacunisphaera sp.]|nr:hypothetical protein [Lacunisphaera sp.]
MSTSPKFDTTVLLWGDRWWLPHHKLPIPFADMAQAADQLAAAWPEANRSLRLIYQPEDFATVPVECPNGNRATLTMALAEAHPVLLHPGHVWSHEPILGLGDGFTTLLHYETKPMLFALVHRLRECGFTVTTVWPMASWLNALPPELSDSGAMTICAIHSDRFCLYRHSADGIRAVRCGHGGDVLTAVAVHLGGLTLQPATEFVLFVTTDEQLVEQLAEKVPLDAQHVVGVFPMWQALAKAAPLGTRHPAQLLPPVPFVTAPQLITLIASVCLLAAAILAAAPVRTIITAQTDREAHENEKQVLRSEIEPLQASEGEVHRLQTRVADLADDPLPWSAWLLAVAKELPAQVVLTGLQADRRGFRVAGGIVGGLSEADWVRWRQSLQDSRGGWSLTESPATKPVGALALKGRWP